jgi:chromosome partitioning protein
MRVVAILGQKGGSGKTTCAVHLAIAAARAERQVVLLDLDPQGSAASWGRRRGPDSVPVTVQAARIQEVATLLSEAKAARMDLVLVDCPGRADAIAMAMLERADGVLVPCRPSILDMEATQRTAEQVKVAGARRAWMVLNAVPPRGTRHLEAQAAMAELMAVCPAVLHARVAFSDALNSGLSVEEFEPKGEAAREVRKLWRWLEREVAA